jgi:uncharacterized membrane protein YGL010W
MSQDSDMYVQMFKHMNEKVIDTANLFLRSAILINGGAAVAVLGFVASIAKAEMNYSVAIVGVADAIAYFDLGAALGVVAIALAYVTNYAAAATFTARDTASEPRLAIAKRIIHVVALGVAVSTIGLFVIGVLTVKAAITDGIV